MTVEERLALLEFQVQLLFDGTDSGRLLFESKVNHEEYIALSNLLQEIRDKIARGEEVHHGKFESDVYRIIPHLNGNFHFCENYTKLCMKERKWEEIFPKLYGDMIKFQSEMENK